MDAAKNSDETTQAPAVEAEEKEKEEDVSLSAVETKKESDTTTEAPGTTTEATDTTHWTELEPGTMVVPETTTAHEVVAQLPGTKEKYEASKTWPNCKRD